MSELNQLITTLESNRHGAYGDLRRQAAEALRSQQQEIGRLTDALEYIAAVPNYTAPEDITARLHNADLAFAKARAALEDRN